MIGYVKGTLEDFDESSITIDVNGIGIHVFVSGGVLAALPAMGSEIKVYTYTYVKEDAFQLYGFLTKDDLALYKQLIAVNGVGPKTGLGFFSMFSASDLRFAIYSADVKTIAKAPGIGKKTAERVIIDLKDKVSLEDNSADALLGQIASAPDMTQSNRKDAIEALVALGYSPAEATKAVKELNPSEDMDVEAILKGALKFLF